MAFIVTIQCFIQSTTFFIVVIDHISIDEFNMTVLNEFHNTQNLFLVKELKIITYRSFFINEILSNIKLNLINNKLPAAFFNRTFKAIN